MAVLKTVRAPHPEERSRPRCPRPHRDGGLWDPRPSPSIRTNEDVDGGLWDPRPSPSVRTNGDVDGGLRDPRVLDGVAANSS